MVTDEALAAWLEGRAFPAKRVTYRVESATSDRVVFAGTETTGRVMLPTSLVREWVEAFDARRIRLSMPPREMREVVRKDSPWAGQLHSFETHLAAVIRQWATEGIERE